MVALYDYATQGPEDLEFSEGDTIDILGKGEALQVKLIRLYMYLFSSDFHLKYCTSYYFFLCSDESHCPVSFSLSLLVNEEWLEGHCAGNIGIFPSCFAYRENDNITQSPYNI